jgi:hypothetical protein
MSELFDLACQKYYKVLPVADRSLYKKIASRLRRLTGLLTRARHHSSPRAHLTTHGTKFPKLAVKAYAQAFQENVESDNEISPSPTSKIRLTHSTPPGRFPLGLSHETIMTHDC